MYYVIIMQVKFYLFNEAKKFVLLFSRNNTYMCKNLGLTRGSYLQFQVSAELMEPNPEPCSRCDFGCSKSNITKNKSYCIEYNNILQTG